MKRKSDKCGLEPKPKLGVHVLFDYFSFLKPLNLICVSLLVR